MHPLVNLCINQRHLQDVLVLALHLVDVVKELRPPLNIALVSQQLLVQVDLLLVLLVVLQQLLSENVQVVLDVELCNFFQDH